MMTRQSIASARRTFLGIGLGCGLAAAAACSADGGSGGPGGMLPDLGGGASEGNDSGSGEGTNGDPTGNGAGGTGSESLPGVSGLDRSPGMAIGNGAAGPASRPGNQPETDPDDDEPGEGPDDATEGDPLDIPTFETPDEPSGPPCSGCAELNMLVDDINQRDDFVFDAGGVNVTRVVWTILLPFNSDQLFVQPFVNGSYGTYTQLHANDFALNTPIELVHQFSGSAGTVGLAIGSSGAWTGDMTMSIFVDAVTLEGANGASRTFDDGLQGLANRTNAHNAAVQYHP